MFNFESIDINCDFEQIYNKEIEAAKKSDKYHRLILIVPQQSSHTVEKQVANYFGGVGFNNIEVMTFRQIIRTFVTRDEDAYIDDVGQTMLTYRSLIDACKDGNVFASSIGRTGFVGDCYKMIREMLSYGVSADELQTTSSKLQDAFLKNKVESFASIYQSYNRIFAERGYKTAEDDTDSTIAEINNSDYFDNAMVWVSLFTELVPQQLQILNAIASKASDVTIHLFAPTEAMVDTSPFNSIKQMEDELKSLCEHNNDAFNETFYKGALLSANDDLRFLSDNYFNFKSTELGSDESIQLVRAKSIFDEVFYVASMIENLVRVDEDLRYGEIGVITTDFESYAPVINTVFADAEIPIFSDYKDPILNHPISVMLSALFDVFENNYQTSDVIRFLRSGLVMSEDDTDRVENFILAKGIRGSMWGDESYWQVFKPNKGLLDDDDDDDGQTVTAPEWSLTRGIYTALESLQKAVSHKAEPKKHATALFEFFDKISLYDNLRDKIKALKASDYDEAVKYSKIWNNLIKLTEQVSVVLADVECSFLDFATYLNMGLASSGISLIPQGVDRVSVSPYGKTSGEPVKVLFLLGATRDGLNSSSKNGAIFTENERGELDGAGVKLALFGTDAINADKLTLYRTLLRAKNRLVISYPGMGIDGSTLMPASLFNELENKFDGLKVTTSELGDGVYTSPHAMAHSLVYNIAKDGYSNKKWSHVAKWFENNTPDFITRLNNIKSNYDNTQHKPLTDEIANALYPIDTVYSSSRIQTYFDCPYKYFLTYGLKLKEQEIYKIKPTDIGIILHDAILKYCTKIDGSSESATEKHDNWSKLTDEESRQVALSAIQESMKDLRDTPYNKKLAERVTDIMLRSALLINQEYKLGSFTSGGYEWAFDDLKFGDEAHTVTLKGFVDRFDIYTSPKSGKTYIRIFDYKTGNKQYKDINVLKKVDIQLIIYSLAVAQDVRGKDGSEALSSGVFYEHVQNNFEDADVNNIYAVSNDLHEMLSGAIYYDKLDEEHANSEIFCAYDKNIYSGSRLYNAAFSTKNQEPDKRKKFLRPIDEIETLQAWVKKSVLDADKEIKQGRIDALPAEDDHGVKCAGMWADCKFKDICDICDKGKRSVRNESMSIAKAREALAQ